MRIPTCQILALCVVVFWWWCFCVFGSVFLAGCSAVLAVFLWWCFGAFFLLFWWCPAGVSHNHQECLTRLSQQSVPQGCPTQVPRKSAIPSVFYKPQRRSYKSVHTHPQVVTPRVSYSRVSSESSHKECHTKSVPQECATGMYYKSVPTSVS